MYPLSYSRMFFALQCFPQALYLILIAFDHLDPRPNQMGSGNHRYNPVSSISRRQIRPMHRSDSTGFGNGIKTIFLLLAFMALARLKSIESLRYCAPGEWGKLLGIDRAPEVRTLRIKLKHLANQGQAFSWSGELCKEWMLAEPEEATVLYVDGHVRVYHGKTKQLPKHYVARERLCLSATADYWVNAMDGKPFFVVSRAVDPGLLQMLEHDIVPRLAQDIPNQPTTEQLDADPLLHRFTIVFDREGYSPKFFAKMKQSRIACLTYHKYPGEDQPGGIVYRQVRLAAFGVD